jgi:hypothetical protein
MITYPQADEYIPYYGRYIERVAQDADVFAVLDRQPDELSTLLQSVSDEQANIHPAAGEWSIKEVIGHLCDAERILAFRALCFARGEKASVLGFEPDDYVVEADFNRRTLADLVEEFNHLRRANVLCFNRLTDAESKRSGIASDNLISVRALVYVLAGHVMHHIESLKTVYKVEAV